MLDTSETRNRLIEEARRLGITQVGFAPVESPRRQRRFEQWLAEGMAGTMGYLHRQATRRGDPGLLLDGARTIISLGESYFTGRLPDKIRDDPARGLFAAYAWGADYHEVFLDKLHALAAWIERNIVGARCVCYVDSGPVSERDHAERAGLGFIGKNTLLIHPRSGSTGFLGEILTTAEFGETEAKRMPSCGSCTRCVDLCPTHAFPASYVLDSRLCISYLTIEYRGIIPRELRPLMKNHVFGCDECQDCCPWNERFSQPATERRYGAMIERQAPLLASLSTMNELEYRERFAGTAVLRASHRMMLRNVALALGNWGSDEALDRIEPLLSNAEPLVRAHAVWAALKIGSPRGVGLVDHLRATESDPRVVAEFSAPR